MFTTIVVALFISSTTSPYAFAETVTQESDINFKTVKKDNKTTHYAFSGDTNKSGVVFIHGTPGDWAAFKGFLNNKELQQHFFMVSVDRIGWGKSTSNNHRLDFDFESQSQSILTVLDQYPNKKWIVVGHSLGASIAPKLALDRYNKLTGLILLSGSLDPDLGKPRWYNHIANNLILKWLLPKKFRDSNKEIMALRNQLSIMHKQIMQTHLDTDLIIIQGMRDRLVSPKNTQFVAQNWLDQFAKVSIIELEDEGHFLPWRRDELISERIMLLGQQ